MESFWSTNVMKKKKFRFGVELKVANLSNYALVKGVLFAKARMEERVNGDFEANTNRVNVDKHRAKWDQSFTFSCKMYAKPQVGILEECMLRVSVRKETKSGKTEKLGYTRLNLAEFAGVGAKERRCLLQAYDTNNYKGHDNSILLVSLCVTLQYGDPVYLRPQSTSPSRSDSVEDPQLGAESFAGVGKSPKGEPSPDSPSTPRRQSALFQNLLARRASLMASLRGGTGLGAPRGDPQLDEMSEDPEMEECGDHISIGSHDLYPEELEVENTLVAEGSSATILSPFETTLSACDERGPHAVALRNQCLSNSNASFPPDSTVSLDSAIESNCSSTALQRSMNSDHLSLSSSTANSASLGFSFQSLAEDCEDEGDGNDLKRDSLLAVEASCSSGSTSAPATVRHKRSSSQLDNRVLDEARFHSLETSSRLTRLQKSGVHSRAGSISPSIKSGSRVSSTSSARASASSIKVNVESTRFDAGELIDALISGSAEDIAEGSEDNDGDSDLQLYVAADGSTAVAGKNRQRPMSAQHYRRVVVDS